ncbi:hypothetical protein C8Q69DRAFT_474930 [Paecilomyces variotii]|uniref:Azaphilone pigments biosynthesis cluster protein L N-terminal domain-containing protein n=1 Tax=Byssochlamys spectabilis TaxID=264951 RepID=A0A443HPU6_BYSSP|nr:hypothetical protein C8Q69DRAFT_474930 [Paecilomyces variotii]RWQ93799.1 hypothetical protein C8Q69DRAFT_474930 [Paecilomyces variotii]
MSGLEAIGVAASIIQVADLGTKVSVRLFSLYRRFKDADQSLRDLSNDVALTCAILRELGESIEKDEQSKLCSEEAHRTLKSILGQCQEVLEQIQNMIDYRNDPQKTPLQRATEKFRNVLLEPKLDPLKSNLERLKSTMLLLLNAIMYAGQIRSKHVPTLLEEQRALLESLLEEKRSNERGPDQFAFIGLSQVTGPESSSSKIHAQNDGDPNTIDGPDELKQYNFLIQRMFHEIDSCKSKLESSRHSRIKDGVLNIHSGEIVRFQLEYGHTALQNFDHSLFADRSTKPLDLKSSAKDTPASTVPQQRHPDNGALERPAIDKRYELRTRAKPVPPTRENPPAHSIELHGSSVRYQSEGEQMTWNPQPNGYSPYPLFTRHPYLSTNGGENSTSTEMDPSKFFYPPPLLRQGIDETCWRSWGNVGRDIGEQGQQAVADGRLSKSRRSGSGYKPYNLVDLMLRWTNIQRDELGHRPQKRHRDSKGQGAPSEKKQRVNNVSEEFAYKPEDMTTATAVQDQDLPNIPGQL